MSKREKWGCEKEFGFCVNDDDDMFSMTFSLINPSSPSLSVSGFEEIEVAIGDCTLSLVLHYSSL